MNSATQLSSTKQIIATVAIATVAFLAALPIGAAIMPDGSANAANVTSAVSDLACKATSPSTSTKKSATSTNKTTATKTITHIITKSHTDTQTSSHNSGSTAQVGHDGVATAVTVGDVLSNNLSNNDVNVPVLSNNTTTTTVSPSVSLLSGNSLLNGSGSLLGGLGL
jgi:hypothetical protein